MACYNQGLHVVPPIIYTCINRALALLILQFHILWLLLIEYIYLHILRLEISATKRNVTVAGKNSMTWYNLHMHQQNPCCAFATISSLVMTVETCAVGLHMHNLISKAKRNVTAVSMISLIWYIIYSTVHMHQQSTYYADAAISSLMIIIIMINRAYLRFSWLWKFLLGDCTYEYVFRRQKGM